MINLKILSLYLIHPISSVTYMAPRVQNSYHNLVSWLSLWKITLLVTRATTILWKPRFHLRPVHVRYVVDKVGAGTQLSLSILNDLSLSLHHCSMFILASSSNVDQNCSLSLSLSLSLTHTHRNTCVFLLLTKYILPNVNILKAVSVSSSSSLSICHAVGPLVDPFRSHVSRSLFKGLPRFFLPVGE